METEMYEPSIRKGYVVVPVIDMLYCRDYVKEELFGTARTCGGCYLDNNGVCKECLVGSDEVIVPEHLHAIIKMNQVQLEEE
jgi:hypothetical protein